MRRQQEASIKNKNRGSLLCREPMTQNVVNSNNFNDNINMDKRNKFSLFCGRTRIVKDGCLACVSLTAAAVVQFIVMGIHNSSGNMYQQILEEFEWEESTSGILCIYLNIFHIITCKHLIQDSDDIRLYF